MPIPVTTLHIGRMIDQLVQNLVGLQRDLHAGSTTWRATAGGQAAPVETLAGWISNTTAACQDRLGWVTAVQANAATWSQIVEMWATQGGIEADIDNLLAALQAAVSSLAAAPTESYADIIAACDQLDAAVDAPLSLWLE